MKIKKIMILFLIVIVFNLVGCEDPHHEAVSEDIYIKDRSHNYIYGQTIAVSSNNNYKCVGSNVEFDEDKKQYTVILEFRHMQFD